MDVIGIIVEYNPFHNGHKYQIEMIKKMYPNSIIIVVMNGNFSQRGEPTIVDKWKRCEMALINGVDLVVELPFVFGTQSADIFAHGALSILNYLKINKLVFGSETNDINLFNELADIQINNKKYDKLVNDYLNKGYNYPTSMSKALKDISNFKIENSNDLLALSYIKEIKKNKYNIEAISIKRTNDYKSNDLNTNIINATTLRNIIKENKDIKKYIPIYKKDLYSNYVNIEDYFKLLKYKILTEKDLTIYQTVDEGIENRINKYIVKSNTYEELINLIKTKRYTYNKISRMLCHILCNFTKEEAKRLKEVEYIRILGFTNSGKKYLNKIKKEISIPLISRFASLKNNEMLNIEYRATKVYNSIFDNNKDYIEEEYKKTPIYFK